MVKFTGFSCIQVSTGTLKLFLQSRQNHFPSGICSVRGSEGIFMIWTLPFLMTSEIWRSLNHPVDTWLGVVSMDLNLLELHVGLIFSPNSVSILCNVSPSMLPHCKLFSSIPLCCDVTTPWIHVLFPFIFFLLYFPFSILFVTYSI